MDTRYNPSISYTPNQDPTAVTVAALFHEVAHWDEFFSPTANKDYVYEANARYKADLFLKRLNQPTLYPPHWNNSDFVKYMHDVYTRSSDKNVNDDAPHFSNQPFTDSQIDSFDDKRDQFNQESVDRIIWGF